MWAQSWLENLLLKISIVLQVNATSNHLAQYIYIKVLYVLIFEILTVVSVTIIAFMDVMPCSLLCKRQSFEEICCFEHKS